MRRRDFIKVIAGSATVWPLAARAQQPAMPVVGFINGGSPEGYAPMVAAFRSGLNERGYIEGDNVLVDTAGPRVTTIVCRRWLPIWWGDRSR
jgi:putative ABC transport system substrate-binding protein